MKNTIRKITALTLAVMTLCGGVSCGKDKPDEISDSQEKEENVDSSANIITIGMPGLNMLAMPYVTGFNDYSRKNNLGYELEIVDYSKMVEDDDDE